MPAHFLVAAKAYTALIGSIVTALLAVYGPDTKVGQVLTVIAAIATAVSTYAVPNANSAPTNFDGE